MNTSATTLSSAGPLSAGQRVAMHYFIAAMVLFAAQILFGLISGLQYIYPDLFFNQLDFNVTRMVHINAMIVWSHSITSNVSNFRKVRWPLISIL